MPVSRVSKIIRPVLWFFAGGLIILAVALSFAQVVCMDFEQPATTRWKGPIGGGSHGGCGGGTLVSSDQGEHVHGGRHALRLEVWDDGSSPQAVAWAGVMHHMPCSPDARVQAEGWVYFSSTNAPLRENGSVHLQIEFFQDADGEELMPQYICVSPPINPATHQFDQWHRVDLRGRIPDKARSLRAGLIVTAYRLGGKKQAVWVDDLSIEVTKRKGGPSETVFSSPDSRLSMDEASPRNAVAIYSTSRYK